MILYHSCQADICASGSAVEHLLTKEGVAGSIPVSRFNKKGYPVGYPFLLKYETHIWRSRECCAFSAVTCVQVTVFDSPSHAFLWYLHQTHEPNNNKCCYCYQGINGNSIEHRCKTGFLEVGYAGSQTNSSQGTDH